MDEEIGEKLLEELASQREQIQYMLNSIEYLDDDIHKAEITTVELQYSIYNPIYWIILCKLYLTRRIEKLLK